MSALPPNASATATERARDSLYGRIYPMRILGMGLGGLSIASVLVSYGASADYYWPLLVLTCLVWPHAAYALARRSTNSFRAEQRNLLVDSAIAGLWVPLMHFNLLPSVMLIMATTFDKLNTGIRGLWLRSLPGMFGAMALATYIVHPVPLLDTTFLVEVCTLPLLVVHTLGSSVTSYRLIRKIAHQNRLLEGLWRTDAQTGLSTREHWLQQAEAVARRVRDGRASAYLLIIDIDKFKRINDSLGHNVGDEAIAVVAAVIRNTVRIRDVGGRLGGDEFAVICDNLSADEAHHIAERIRGGVERTRLPDAPDLRLSCSIGIAAASVAHADLREWMAAADSALYAAKRAGRNTVYPPAAGNQATAG